MRVTLLIVDGPHEGGKVSLRDGQTVQVGRSEWSDFAFPRDGYMSGVHFSLECDRRTCRLRDLNSSNGTSVNGKELSEAVLEDGDKVFSGQTMFEVRIEDAAPAGIPAPVAPPESNIVAISPREMELRLAERDADQASDAAGRADAASRLVEPAPLRAASEGSSVYATLRPGMNDDPARPYQAALEDEDPTVRRQALLAAAWTSQRWLLRYCRKLSQRPTVEYWDATVMLAILGKPEDLERILAVGRAEELGPERFQALGAYGHPGVVRLLLDAMHSDDPALVAASGAAFTKITGAEIDSAEAAESPSEGGTEPDEVALPSPQRAKADWRQRKEQFSAGTRYCRGFDLSRPPSEEILRQLDMESCWEARLRGKFEGTWRRCFLDQEKFSPFID